MARKHEMPDPKDRSVNSPSVIVDASAVLGNYNAHHDKDERKERVVDSVKSWFIDKAKAEGWKNAAFHGSDCLLEVEVIIKSK